MKSKKQKEWLNERIAQHPKARFLGVHQAYTVGERPAEWRNFKDYKPQYVHRYLEYLRLCKEGLY